MDCNREEVIEALAVAETKLQRNDLEGARRLALKASNLFPTLDNVSQLVAVCDVLLSSENNVIDDEKDWYGILQVESHADDATIRKQYRKLALLLHPDKNKYTGAESAFKLVGEANAVLVDHEKRLSYDRKCRASARSRIPHPPASHRAFNKKSDAQETFWTRCPFCKVKMKYYVKYVNKIMRCHTCLQAFTALDSVSQGVAQESEWAGGSFQGVGTGSSHSASRTSSSAAQESKRACGGSQGVGTGSSHFTSETTSSAAEESIRACETTYSVPKADIDTSHAKQMSKEEVIIEQRGSKPAPGQNAKPESTNCRRSSRQKRNVSYNEDLVDDYFAGLTEESQGGKSEANKNKKCKASADGVTSEPNVDDFHHDQKLDTASLSQASKCPELEFTDFNKNRDEKSFAANQIWACYDSVDGMPRFYAHIRKVYSPFMVKFSWLEPNPEEPRSSEWVNRELPMASGRFKKGRAEETLSRSTFSHRMEFKKGQWGSYFVYPQKGETWAIYKNWSIEWISDPQSHKPFSFVLVEVRSDFLQETGIQVCYLEKVQGFVSLYQRMAKEGVVTYLIPSNEILRFSHRVPSVKLKGVERQGVLVGSFELDPAALPSPGEFVPAALLNPCELEPVAPKEVSQTRVDPVAPSNSNKIWQFVKPKPDTQTSDESVNPTHEEKNPPRERIKSLCYDGLRTDEEVIHDFQADKVMGRFRRGQIWALYNKDSGFPNTYAQIQRVEATRFNLHAALLQPCTSTQPICCGTFDVLARKPKFYNPLSFSHKMDVVHIDNNKVKVYPRRGEIWAIYKNWTAGMPKENCKYEIVEVVRSSEEGFDAWLLIYYGFKSVFRHERGDRMRKIILEIPRDELCRFSHQIPAFGLTGEKDGFLRGFYELDPAAVPPDVYGRKK